MTEQAAIGGGEPNGAFTVFEQGVEDGAFTPGMELAGVVSLSVLVDFEQMEAEAKPDATGFRGGQTNRPWVDSMEGLEGTFLNQTHVAIFGEPDATFFVRRESTNIRTFREAVRRGAGGNGASIYAPDTSAAVGDPHSPIGVLSQAVGDEFWEAVCEGFGRFAVEQDDRTTVESQPERAVASGEHGNGAAIRWGNEVGWRELLKTDAVESNQSAGDAEPDIAVPSLSDGCDGVVGQGIFIGLPAPPEPTGFSFGRCGCGETKKN